ncbi:VWA domain-containing protein [Capnocytophaga sp. 051621]|uniref:VWA domain-containing protein n=2 Tax=Capnocytophaga TaxID=1016 RepID=A0ABS1YU11_9FLAO|nr:MULTISPECIES: VWA domain-containing protein [Capnocytophaga]MBI1646677.1 VWA domain-containing protein [Capnocytophaga periodontitidis]MBM0649897.1 VWA domain-containing protein [Capnocytophaga genosp. AHN8471]MBM0662371.1 VWA domain-containing protein [Capnocytophaga genosp. AHN8471]
MLKNITFANPQFFWLLLVLPLMVAWYMYWNKKSKPNVTLSSTIAFRKISSWKDYLYHSLFALRLLAVALITIALARPQTHSENAQTKITDGIDIVMAIDVSSSMLSQDLKPNRFEALKKVASQFVKDRPNDRIGLVVYAGESYTKTPVTTDKSIILNSLAELTYGQVEDGTAIGMGLATAVNRLKESKAKSRVIILLTDGVNNTGVIDPLIAAELAAEYGIKVYTVGIGTNGMALSPYALNPDGSIMYRMLQVEIDESLMKKIAQITHGLYFRATNNQKLQQIYDEINKLETSKIEEFKYTEVDEKFRLLVIIAAVLLFLEFLLKHTVFRNEI